MSLIENPDIAVEVPEPEALGSPGSRRDHGPWLALLGFITLTVFAMWPAISDLGNTIMGSQQPSDATNGGVWTAWQLQIMPPLASHTPWLAAPQGSPLWDTDWITKLVWLLPQWLLVEIVGPVASWNLTMAIGFVADGMAMYGLARWLTGRNWIAFVAGVLFAFSPFHVEQSHNSIGYVYSFIFPLILWAGLALLQRPTIRRGLLFGVTVGLSTYFDGYYVVFAPLFAICIAVAGFLWAKRLGVKVSNLVKPLAAAVGVAAIVGAPLVLAYLVNPAGVSGDLGIRTQTDIGVTRYSAQFWMYFVPWSSSLPWGWLTHAWVLHAMGPALVVTGSTEVALYLGGVVVLLALAPLFVLLTAPIRRRTRNWDSSCRTPYEKSAASIRMPADCLAPALIFVAAALILCSFAWFGPVPGVPILIYHVKPFWRVYSRMDVAVDPVVILAATIALAILARSRRGWIAPFLAILAIVDATAILPWSSWSYSEHTPAAYAWLAAHQDGGLVATYPMPIYGGAQPLPRTFQPMNQHPLFFGVETNTPHGELQYGLADITDPQTISTLRRIGVRYVLIDRHKALYNGLEFRKLRLPGLHRILSRQGEVLYRTEPGPVPPAALTEISGMPWTLPAVPKFERYMNGQTAELGLWVFQHGVPLRITFQAQSWKRPRHVTVTQNGVTRWQGRVDTQPTKISFTTSSDSPLHIRCRPGYVAIPPYYQLTVDLTGFQVQRA